MATTTRLKKPSTPVRRKMSAASSVTSPSTATKYPYRAPRLSESQSTRRAPSGRQDLRGGHRPAGLRGCSKPDRAGVNAPLRDHDRQRDHFIEVHVTEVETADTR